MAHRNTLTSHLSLPVLLCTAVLEQQTLAAEPSTAVSRLDHDNDQTLDWAEVQAGAGARFDTLNKDNDGTLDAREVKGMIGETVRTDCWCRALPTLRWPRR
jgi:hypothetical protein